MQNFAGIIDKTIKKSDSNQNESRELATEIKDALSIFQNSLNIKDAEIERLKKGNDAEVYRRFLNRFIRLYTIIEEEIEDMSDSDSAKKILTDIQQLLEDALIDCGLETFSPEVGQGIREAFGIAERPELIETTDESKHLCIAEVLRPGV